MNDLLSEPETIHEDIHHSAAQLPSTQPGPLADLRNAANIGSSANHRSLTTSTVEDSLMIGARERGSVVARGAGGSTRRRRRRLRFLVAESIQVPAPAVVHQGLVLVRDAPPVRRVFLDAREIGLELRSHRLDRPEPEFPVNAVPRSAPGTVAPA